MRRPVEQKVEVIQKLLKEEIDTAIAASILQCDKRTVRNYRRAFIEKGAEGLKDHRHSNNYRLTVAQREQIRKVKGNERWRSGRNIRDKLGMKVYCTHEFGPHREV